MPRFIVLLILGFLIYRVFKRLSLQATAKPPAATPAAIGFAPIAACALCGVHVPLSDSVTGADGRTFCSEAHCHLAHAPGL